MKKIILLTCLLVVTGFLFSGTTEYYEGELIIQIKGDYLYPLQIEESLNQLTTDFQDYELRIDRQLSRRLRIYLIAFDYHRVNTAQFLARIKEHPAIEIAQHNHKVSLRQTIPDDPLFDQQWALLNTGQNGGTPGADIDATLAWDITTGGQTATGREIVIAIIDDGYALNHPDIDFWKNENEIPGNGQDDDGNGYIDDYDGWNAYNNSGNLPVASHGTHVSGIAAAVGNNDLGVSGVNWGAKIMPIAGSSSSEAIVIAAYGYVHDMRSLYNDTNGVLGAYIVATNSSFGVNYGQPDNYPLWGAMYDAMGDVGILSAAATMNINADVDVVGDVPTAFPSPYLLGVTNTTRFDVKNASAAYGATTIDLGAPGTEILSTVPSSSYSTMTGTSMASPHVAGAIAMMYAAAPAGLLDLYENDPAGLALIFKDLLLQSVDIIPSLENVTVSGGRLNLNNALQMVIDYPYEIITPAPYDLVAEYTGEEVILNWEASEDRIPQFFYIFRNGSMIQYQTADETSYTDSDLEDGWTYEYFVIAGYLDPLGTSEPSNSAFVTIPPVAPQLVYPQDGATDIEIDLILQWQEVFGGESYILDVAYDEDFTEYFLESISITESSYDLPLLDFEVTYYWRVLALNAGGMSGWATVFSFSTEQDTSLEDEPLAIITGLKLIYPNPFSLRYASRSRGLQIDLALEQDSLTNLAVYNIKGQLVCNLVDQVLNSGKHSFYWEGTDTTGRRVSSGVYFIRMNSSQHSENAKILLIN